MRRSSPWLFLLLCGCSSASPVDNEFFGGDGGLDASAEDLGIATCDSLPVPLDASPTDWAIEAPNACDACPDAYFSGGDFDIRPEADLLAAPEPLLEGAFEWLGVTASPEGARVALGGEDEASLLLPFVDAADLAWVPSGARVEAVLSLEPLRWNRFTGGVRGEWELRDDADRVLLRAFFEGGAEVALSDARREELAAMEPGFGREPLLVEWDGHRIVGSDAVACQEDNSPLGRYHVRGVSARGPDGARFDAPFGASVELVLDGAPARLRGTFRTCYLVPEDRGAPPVGTGFCSRAGGAAALAIRLAP